MLSSEEHRISGRLVLRGLERESVGLKMDCRGILLPATSCFRDNTTNSRARVWHLAQILASLEVSLGGESASPTQAQVQVLTHSFLRETSYIPLPRCKHKWLQWL